MCIEPVQGSPLQRVWAEETSGSSLGIGVKAFDVTGNVVVGYDGYRFTTAPMPVGF